MNSDFRILILDPNDNIGVATQELSVGTKITLPDGTLTLLDTIDIGHKFALHNIAANEKIIKYQAPIGHATHPIKAGEYVHSHNMVSDYLPTYSIDSEEQRV